jgi:hypothetical protein
MPSRPAAVSSGNRCVSDMGRAYANGATIAILGATNPLASAPGTIRGDYAIVRATQAPISWFFADIPLGRRPQRLPRFRQRRERQEGDCPLVQARGAHLLEERCLRLDLREGLNFSVRFFF